MEQDTEIIKWSARITGAPAQGRGGLAGCPRRDGRKARRPPPRDTCEAGAVCRARRAAPGPECALEGRTLPPGSGLTGPGSGAQERLLREELGQVPQQG